MTEKHNIRVSCFPR